MSGKPTHGQSRPATKEYYCWKNMKARCLNKNATYYEYYGGRGITFCTEWVSFQKFFEDMGKTPTDRHTIERIDSDGNYEPGNCRWATRVDQSRNIRTPRTNKSGHKGVYWNTAANKWQAYITTHGETKYLGIYSDVNEAAAARQFAETEMWGQND